MAKNTADIGFEKEIWDAECVLRDNMDASEYKNIILGLIFLKYISDSFEEKYYLFEPSELLPMTHKKFVLVSLSVFTFSWFWYII